MCVYRTSYHGSERKVSIDQASERKVSTDQASERKASTDQTSEYKVSTHHTSELKVSILQARLAGGNGDLPTETLLYRVNTGDYLPTRRLST